MRDLLGLVHVFLLIEVFAGQELLSEDRCNHFPDRGSCETSFEVKWYYDRFGHRCRRFFYGGCDGNGNRFDSLEECQQTCPYQSQNDVEEDPNRRCFLPHDPGHCSGSFERWHFDATVGQCVCSWWSGCGGNSNSRYYSFQHCMYVCGTYANNPTNEVSSQENHLVQRTPFRPGSKMQVDTNLWDTNLDHHPPSETLRFEENDEDPFSIDAHSAEISKRKRREKARFESYETPFSKIRQAKKDRRVRRATRYEEYAETPAFRSPANYPPVTPASRKAGIRYEEYAETPYRWPNYAETTTDSRSGQLPLVLPSSPRESPRIPQEILNRLIQQYLAKRPQYLQEPTLPTRVRNEDRQPAEVHYALYRRFPTNSSQLSYAEKRRRWKAEMNQKMKAAKIPPRPINPQPPPTNTRADDQTPTKKGKYNITYSPYHRLYHVSRQRPTILNDDGQERADTSTPFPVTTSTRTASTTETPVQTTPRTQPPTTRRPVYTTTTTPKPKVVRVPAETVTDSKGAQLTVRVASIKPTAPPIKQIISLDDYDLSEEDDDEGAHSEQPQEVPTKQHYGRVQNTPFPTLIPYKPQTTPYVPPPTPYRPQHPPTHPPHRPGQIVYPVGHKPGESSTQPAPTTRRPFVAPITTPRVPAVQKKIEETTNFFAPPVESGEQDYDDVGDSEEDLFFWKPDYEQRKGIDRVQPPDTGRRHHGETDMEDEPFKIEVHEAVR